MISKLQIVDYNFNEIAYKHTTFPDGQQNIEILDKLKEGYEVKIIGRMNSFLDLEKIICATQSIRSFGEGKIDLHVPYLLGARSDRKFVEGGNSYLSNVIGPILNLQKYNKIYTYDVHNRKAAREAIDNLEDMDNSELLSHAIRRINPDVLVCPDKGAFVKILDIAQKVGFNGEILVCQKERDAATGRITKTSLPEDFDGSIYGMFHRFLILDDICDGGGTFLAIAELLPKDSLKYLAVSHGIFSKGVGVLTEHFEKIFTTNSIQDDYHHSAVEVLKIYE